MFIYLRVSLHEKTTKRDDYELVVAGIKKRAEARLV